MSTGGDRRTQGASRIPFEALVEVGGALGPSFEAQAVNISEEGMQLRTAYLPEQGQPLTCRFDAGPGQSVLASGEVIWTEQAGKGGEFGIRFTDMDPESIDVLRRMCGVAAEPGPRGHGEEGDRRSGVVEEAVGGMEGRVGRGVAAVGPGVREEAAGGETAGGAPAAEPAWGEGAGPPRRNAAAPPGGGLHTAG